MEIEVLKKDDGRVRYSSLILGSCFKVHLPERNEEVRYLMRMVPGSVDLSDARTISFHPEELVYPVCARVVIGGR